MRPGPHIRRRAGPGALGAAAPAAPADAVLAARDEVFRRPEFGGGGRSLEWLLRPLRDFFGWLGGLSDASPVLFWLLFTACLLALAGTIGLVAYQVRSVFVAGGRLRAGTADRAARRIQVSADYQAQADERAGRGEYTEAVRFLFLAMVYRLDEQGRVGFDGAYTNREYLYLVGDRPTVRDALAVVVDTLDDHWYGQRPCDRLHYLACRAVYDRLASA